MQHLFNMPFRNFHKNFGGYFTSLLISLIALFIFRPHQKTGIYLGIWEALLITTFISAIFNCNHKKWIKFLAAMFAVPALFFEWFNLFYHHKLNVILFLIFTTCFVFISTTSILKTVLIGSRVKIDTLRGVVCGYFMIAFAFAFIYSLLHLLYPNSFTFANLNPITLSSSHYLSQMMYFSFVTLLSIGYGDITPTQDIGQTFVILEGIIGQFYIAILVSRLVSVYSFFEHKLHLVAKKSEPPK